MSQAELENLVKLEKLHRAQSTRAEREALHAKGKAKLKDAQNAALGIESRFELAYAAAHDLALAALWRAGYRSDDRTTAFQCLTHTSTLAAPTIKALVSAHKRRNHMAYEAETVTDADFVQALISATTALEADVRKQLK